MKNTLLILSIMILALLGCSSFGTAPDKATLQSFSRSQQYNSQTEQFENRRADVIEKDRQAALNVKFIWKWLKGGVDSKPEAKLPEIKPNLDEFLASSNEVKIIWLGHSTLLINFEGKIVLIDPVFSQYASPVSFIGRRFQNTVLTLNELPTIDFILLSHDHYDHLDVKTIQYFVGKDVRFITPLGVGSHLMSWGIQQERIFEKDWWESIVIDKLEFIAAPSQHFSGRGLFDANKTLWSSWIVRTKRHSIFFSGDSGYDTHFKEIGNRYGPFDIAFLENGQYNDRFKSPHMLPEEAVVAYKDLRAKKLFPIHWGMFSLSTHPWYEPPERLLTALGSRENLLTPKIGRILTINSSNDTNSWWRLDGG